MVMEKLFLLDAYALIYRSYYAFIKNPRINSKGLNTSAIMGFLNTLQEVLTKEQPTHLGVAFDPHGPTFRSEAYPAYKAQREATPEDIKQSVPIIKNILKYLTPKEAIYFYSVNNYFNKGRIIFFDSKKEELLSILNLKKDETIENKIIEIKNKFTKENLSNKKKFEITKETKEIIKKMNTEEYLNKLENIASDNNNENLIIIYKILFVLLNEENIYNILNKNIFWKKCIDFFKTNCPEGKVGDFILLKIPNFKFDIKEFNKIQKLLKGNKNQIINEISNNKDFLIMPLIKESLEYCGVIFSENKTEGNIYIKNLRKNQIMINYLNNLKVRYFLSKYNEEDEED